MTDKRLDSASSGFSMMEMLVSMVILAVGLLAIVSMQGTAMTGNNLSKSMTQGYYVGQSQMENLIQQGYDSVSNGPATRSFNNVNYTINWQIIENVYIDDMKTIEMTVSWSRKGEGRNIELTRSVPEII